MGGEHENVIRTNNQSVRIHESGGQVHFHVDEEGLKVSIPVAEWWKGWQSIKHHTYNNYEYIDTINNSHLYITNYTTVSESNENINIDTSMIIRKINPPNDIYTKLAKFTERNQ